VKNFPSWILVKKVILCAPDDLTVAELARTGHQTPRFARQTGWPEAFEPVQLQVIKVAHKMIFFTRV